METLCAYVRNNAGPARPINEAVRIALMQEDSQVQPDAENLIQERHKGPTVDVQAALSVIGRRSENRRMHEARLRSLAPREDAYRLDLTSTNLQGACLSGLHLEEARLDGSNLALANLDSAHLEGASLNNAHLEGASVYFTRFNHARLIGAHLECARGQKTRFIDAQLDEAHLECANLRAVQLQRAFLASAHLECSNLTLADMTDCALMSAHLEGAVLSDVNFRNADLCEASLDDALLDASDLSTAGDVTQEMLCTAFGDLNTKIPVGLDLPGHWLPDNAQGIDSYRHRAEWRIRRARWLPESRTKQPIDAA